MKKTMHFFPLVFTLLLTACSIVKPSVEISEANPETVFEIKEVVGSFGMTSRISYNTLQKLIEPANWGADVLEDFSADLVVIGEFVEEAKTELSYSYSEFYGKDIVVDGNAKGLFLVTEVLKGDIKPGEVITIIQRYAFDRERGALISFSELTPIHKGDRWIYFLIQNANGDYYSAGDSDGRYPIPNETIEKAMDMFPQETLSIFKNSYNEKIGMEYDNACERVLGTMDVSALGVINHYHFNFALYAEVLDDYGIETQDWVNPGRGLDARIIEIYGNTDR